MKTFLIELEIHQSKFKYKIFGVHKTDCPSLNRDDIAFEYILQNYDCKWDSDVRAYVSIVSCKRTIKVINVTMLTGSDATVLEQYLG